MFVEVGEGQEVRAFMLEGAFVKQEIKASIKKGWLVFQKINMVEYCNIHGMK
jgi:hypothetical protein